MADITIRQAATTHQVAYDTLYRIVKKYPEQFHAHAETVIGQPRSLWFLDDETEGFKSWVARYQRKQQQKNDFSERSKNSSKLA